MKLVFNSCEQKNLHNMKDLAPKKLESDEEILILKRQLERQKSARKQAESILEEKSYELYQANQSLQESIALLDKRVDERTQELTAAKNLSDKNAHDLEKSNKRFELVLDASQAGLWEINCETLEVRCSERLANMFQLPLKEVTEKLSNLSIFAGETRSEVKACLNKAMASETTVNLECEIVAGTGAARWFKLNARTHFNTNGKALWLAGAFVDINERVEIAVSAQHMATHDNLTNIANRALFNKKMEEAFEASLRSSEVFSVIILDLNAFKEVNDEHGHQAGDQLLRHVANNILSVVKNTDTVARLGGDEFAIILRGIKTAAYVQAICEKIIHRCGKKITCNEVQVGTYISMGVATYPNDGKTTSELIRNADLAMYHAKKKKISESAFHVFSHELVANIQQARAMRLAIKEGIEKQDFILHYQPKYSIENNRILGVEALIRWPRADGSYTPPDEFIPHAEEGGLINELSEWIINEGCKQAARWFRQGLEIPVAINLSPLQFTEQNLPDIFYDALRRNNLPGRMIGVEITENCVIDDLHRTNHQLSMLRALGLEVSIDDFGTGYSSLSYLHQLPIQVIKIDRSFIGQVTDNPESATIADAIIKLSHSLGATVVAEGVETEEQLAWLKERKCEAAQGYYFSPALPAAKIPTLASVTFQASSKNSRQAG
jgi:diguanylate cyclase (GGDEF)-like protein/PAS domain S-box-containing protein